MEFLVVESSYSSGVLKFVSVPLLLFDSYFTQDHHGATKLKFAYIRTHRSATLKPKQQKKKERNGEKINGIN